MLTMSEARAPSGSSRTCVGCQKEAAPEELVRFVLGPDGELGPVLSGKQSGRGAWVHPRTDCLGAAAKRGFAKSFRAPVQADAAELAARIRAAADRRVQSLLGAALGARQLAVGVNEVKEALGSSKARLLIVATDARAAAEAQEVRAAVARGLARAWGTKSELGRVTRRNETGIVAVLDSGLGRALAQTIDWAHTAEPTARDEAGGDLPTEE
ncbi:MAG: YlxR family protein [Sorangiineae bacterium PRO1]|nr:YlxR family protein [Sorangiineae bacterium PRO1]